MPAFLRRKNKDKPKQTMKNSESIVFNFVQEWEAVKALAFEEGSQNKEKIDAIQERFAAKFRRHTEQLVQLQYTTPEVIVEGLMNRIKHTTWDDEKEKRNKRMLLDALQMLMDFKTNSTSLVQSVVTMLFGMSGYIDREIFMFEFHQKNDMEALPRDIKASLKERRTQLMTHLGGWAVPKEKPWTKYSALEDAELYLELPIRRAHNLTNSSLMAEALYREQNIDFVLLLLQNGYSPSCLYLWPICILLDLQISINFGYKITKPEEGVEERYIANSFEAKVLRLFCRARHHIHVHIVKTPEERDPQRLPSDVPFDRMLLVPPSVLPILPADRYKHPSSLMHQSRLAVRKVMLKNGRIPNGIMQLPLPEIMNSYLNLLED